MPAMAAAYQTLSRAAVPRATTAINIIRTVGGSFGTAVLSVVLERRIEANLPGVGGSLASLRAVGGGAPPPRIADALAHAFGHTFCARADRAGARAGVLPPAPPACARPRAGAVARRGLNGFQCEPAPLRRAYCRRKIDPIDPLRRRRFLCATQSARRPTPSTSCTAPRP